MKKTICHKELKTMLIPIIGTIFIFVQAVFGVEIPEDTQFQLVMGIVNLVAIGSVIYGIWHSHDEDSQKE